eukprot:752277-Hanusia_phi.AAC.1
MGARGGRRRGRGALDPEFFAVWVVRLTSRPRPRLVLVLVLVVLVVILVHLVLPHPLPRPLLSYLLMSLSSASSCGFATAR